MKLGDFALNKKMINEVETHLKNMTPEEVQEMEIMEDEGNEFSDTDSEMSLDGCISAETDF